MADLEAERPPPTSPKRAQVGTSPCSSPKSRRVQVTLEGRTVDLPVLSGPSAADVADRSQAYVVESPTRGLGIVYGKRKASKFGGKRAGNLTKVEPVLIPDAPAESDSGALLSDADTTTARLVRRAAPAARVAWEPGGLDRGPEARPCTV
jgi:hypothetical protein